MKYHLYTLLLAVAVFGGPAYSQSNPIQIENQNAGTTDWQIANPATNREIEGYASLTSVNIGGSINLFVSTADPSYTIDVFRIGWYGGLGGRRMLPTITRSGGVQTTQRPIRMAPLSASGAIRMSSASRLTG